jgi:lysozyme
MNYARLESRICLDEGFRAMPYLDTVGVATIGYGTTAILGEPVTLAHPAITSAVARQLLRIDLFTACLAAQSVVPRFDEMNHVRQEVLVNMAYNLGAKGLKSLTSMIAAAQTLNFALMAERMRSFKWYRQVKQRGERLAQAMQTGEW